MAKGDGRGGNHGKEDGGGLRLSRREILLRRIALHESQSRNKELGKRERRRQLAMAIIVAKRLRRFDERQERKLELKRTRKPSAAADMTHSECEHDRERLNREHEILERRKEIPVASTRLSDRIINGLEEIGVLWVRELMAMTAGDVLALPNFGEGVLREIRRELKRLGLALREAAEGGEAGNGSDGKPLPVNFTPPLMLQKFRVLAAAMAAGATSREADQLADAGSYRGYSLSAELRRRIRRWLQRGCDASEVATSLLNLSPQAEDFQAVVAWIESLPRDRA